MRFIAMVFITFLVLPSVSIAEDSRSKSKMEAAKEIASKVDNPFGNIGAWKCRNYLSKLRTSFKKAEGFPELFISAWLQGFIASRNMLALNSEPLELSGLSNEWLFSEYKDICSKTGNKLNMVIAAEILQSIAAEQDKEMPKNQMVERIYKKYK